MERLPAEYQINFYGQDHSVMVNQTSNWPGLVTNGELILNVTNDDAVLVWATVLSIRHPVFGPLRGFYSPGSSDITCLLILDNYEQLQVDDEEHPGFIPGKNVSLQPAQFELVLWKPDVTDIPYHHAYAGLTNNERQKLFGARDTEIRKALKIE
ncbi:MAG: hypothetical protein ACYDCO_17020 [Armatimonadota bacterium]